MSHTLTVVLALTLAVPALLFIAVAAVSGVSPDLISGGVTFFVVGSAVIAMVFEIKRMADS